MAVVTFNTKPYTALNFASPSDKVIKKIGSIKKPGGCGTSLGRAIYAARRVLIPSTRTSSNKAMFVISTGTLNMGTSHPKAARLLQTENSFQVFAIAIGKRPDRKILQSVVSQPEKNHVISLRNVGNVFDAVRRTVTTQKKGKPSVWFPSSILNESGPFSRRNQATFFGGLTEGLSLIHI